MNTMNRKKVIMIILLCASALFLILGFVNHSAGVDRRDNYYYHDDYPSVSHNAYVGGDAYNYIINGTHYAGYFAFSGAMFICACICGVSAAKLYLSMDETKQDEIKAEMNLSSDTDQEEKPDSAPDSEEDKGMDQTSEDHEEVSESTNPSESANEK